MTTNDKTFTRNYDSDTEKSDIDNDLQSIPGEVIAFYNKVNVSIDSLL